MLDGAILDGATLVILDGATLDGAILDGSILNDATLVILDGAKLDDATLVIMDSATLVIKLVILDGPGVVLIILDGVTVMLDGTILVIPDGATLDGTILDGSILNGATLVLDGVTVTLDGTTLVILDGATLVTLEGVPPVTIVCILMIPLVIPLMVILYDVPTILLIVLDILLVLIEDAFNGGRSLQPLHTSVQILLLRFIAHNFSSLFLNPSNIYVSVPSLFVGVSLIHSASDLLEWITMMQLTLYYTVVYNCETYIIVLGSDSTLQSDSSDSFKIIFLIKRLPTSTCIHLICNRR